MDSLTFSDAVLPTILADSGVRTRPGATTLIRTPRGAYVAAAESPRPVTPAFAAAMAS